MRNVVDKKKNKKESTTPPITKP